DLLGPVGVLQGINAKVHAYLFLSSTNRVSYQQNAGVTGIFTKYHPLSHSVQSRFNSLLIGIH
ncbi:MAG: hypothetical protein ACO30K_18090, partial [bacterium]